MGNVIICVVLAVIIAVIIFKMVKDKKSGKSSCGGNCAGCSGCAANAGADVETVLTIDGMMCGMCESHINDTIRKSFDVKKVKSSHKTGKTVIVSKKPLDRDKLKTAIDQTGYRLLEINNKAI